MLAWSLNVAGLGVSAVGALFLFFGTPADIIGGSGVTWATLKGTAEGDAGIARRRRLSRWGIGLVGAGFVLQLVAALMHPGK